jgi:hypothetical protein
MYENTKQQERKRQVLSFPSLTLLSLHSNPFQIQSSKKPVCGVDSVPYMASGL